ncbi:SDR family oxidoreductase [Brevibacterium picturae]|uniref:Enoyl-(Acyl carrier protein) reductase n=1 Tax=Brevibacterium picturae TaxID=260553 RepID=A0ABN2B216_9MICO
MEALAACETRVNTVVPGFTDNGHPLFSDPGAREHMSDHTALGGVAEPAVVAEGLAFLLSDRSRRTTGSILDVSGGSRLGYRGGASGVSLRSLR